MTAPAAVPVPGAGVQGLHGFATWLILTVGWVAGAFGGGAALAWMYKRLHPRLAFYKLWAFWTMVLSGVAAIAFGFHLV